MLSSRTIYEYTELQVDSSAHTEFAFIQPRFFQEKKKNLGFFFFFEMFRGQCDFL